MVSRLDYKLVNIYNRALFDKETACSVCLVPFLSGPEEEVPNVRRPTKRYVKQLLCGHSFHVNCINTWFAHRNHTCPVCRRLVFSSCAFHSESTDSSTESESGSEPGTENVNVLVVTETTALLITSLDLTHSDEEYLSS